MDNGDDIKIGDDLSVDKAILLHRALAVFHANRAQQSRTTVVFSYHDDLAWRINDAADRLEYEETHKWPRRQT